MLELKSIEWQNFLSYGDYPTKIDLDDLGQCLIIGEVIEDDAVSSSASLSNIRKSNGAGKSTIPNAIQWALFGRTMHSRSPGDNVVNYFTGKDCWAKLIFKNGDMILRTRKTNGINELLYVKDGDETLLTANTVSTVTIQQQKLNKAFNLDWEIFCGSVFFNQYGKPWMEMADATRKKAIERILHVDRLAFYAQAAKSQCDNLDNVVSSVNMKYNNALDNIELYKSEIDRCRNLKDQFESNKLIRIRSALESANQIESEIEQIELPNIEQLKQKWAIIQKIKVKLQELQDSYNEKCGEISTISGTIKSLEEKVSSWTKKSGKTCVVCEQVVNGDHAHNKIQPIEDELQSHRDKLQNLFKKRDAIKSTIDTTKNILDTKQPDMTLAEAERVKIRIANLQKDAARYKNQAKSIESESNPHDNAITEYEKKIETAYTQLKTHEDTKTKSEYLNKHYHYIHKAYHDRSKIKGYIFREHIPYINARLQYYLEIFDLDIKIELTDSLGISSNMWGYEYESGGERKRTDVAFMLAMFDFHEQIYGRQCNVLVMDEVDGRLDDDGIEALINIIKTDLAHRVESILLISHRNMMFDTFSRELRVTRQGRFSKLEVI